MGFLRPPPNSLHYNTIRFQINCKNKNKHTKKLKTPNFFVHYFIPKEVKKNPQRQITITIKAAISRNQGVSTVEIKMARDFPGGAVGKTPCSQCRGPGFDPWSGN